jgi:hypothetical protein
MRCLSCHYDLRKLTGRRCPECGCTFDPNDPSTYYDPPMIVTLGMILRVAMVCYALNCLVLLYLTINDTPTEFGKYFAIPIAAGVLLVFTLPIGTFLYAVYWLLRHWIHPAD